MATDNAERVLILTRNILFQRPIQMLPSSILQTHHSFHLPHLLTPTLIIIIIVLLPLPLLSDPPHPLLTYTFLPIYWIKRTQANNVVVRSVFALSCVQGELIETRVFFEDGLVWRKEIGEKDMVRGGVV